MSLIPLHLFLFWFFSTSSSVPLPFLSLSIPPDDTIPPFRLCSPSHLLPSSFLPIPYPTFLSFLRFTLPILSVLSFPRCLARHPRLPVPLSHPDTRQSQFQVPMTLGYAPCLPGSVKVRRRRRMGGGSWRRTFVWKVRGICSIPRVHPSPLSSNFLFFFPFGFPFALSLSVFL